ncbi:unnamed protein product [Mytilus edulis]|uniref:B box-type domain-containing protein n=1 Tax=Mytilus edulis TaxID=6550 RepID=A0A8S3V6Y1_MYTED|nr:unnamed protein product [Mytilus edulis]
MASKMVMCDPCSRLNKSSEGLKYCTDCEDTLFTDCAALHSAVKLLASHHLVDVSVTTGNTFNIKKDCGDHEGCVTKIALLLNATKELIVDRRENKTRVKEIKAKVLKVIAKFRQDINGHLDQLEKKLIYEVDTIDKTNREKARNDLAEADKRQNDIIEMSQKVDFLTKHGSESQLFIHLNTITLRIFRRTKHGIKNYCEDALCTDCTALHSAVKLLASHHLVDVSVTSGNTFNIKKDCNDHEGKYLEFFCSDHDCLICRTCMANTHRTCGKIQPIDVAAEGCRTSSMLENVSKDIASLLISTKALSEDRQKKKTSVGQSKAKVLKEIVKFRQKINYHLDQLENKCCSEVDILESTISKTVDNELSEADKRQHVIQNIWEQVDFFTKHGSESQLFIFLNTVKSDISRQAVSLQDLIPSLETNDIGFEPSNLISVMKTFGSVTKTSIPCSVKYQHPNTCKPKH